MSKHTPGPWCVRHDDMVCSQEGRIIADCESTPYAMRPAPPIVEDKANATLIAAAPAMYEALQIMVKAANVDEIDPLVMFASIERAKSALAQAEGHQHG